MELQFSGFLGARQGVFGPFGLILISDPLAGHAFPRQQNMCREGGRGYLFLSGFFFMYDAIHGWTGHVMKKASLKTMMTSFTICNILV
jgi:hypothetical protein